MTPSPQIKTDALLTADLDAFAQPGVVVEVDAADADLLGAFLETALSEDEAWAAKDDLPVA